METVKKVFLSSTARDLAEYREAAAKAIDAFEGYKCVKMEDFTATDMQAADYCRDRVLECDVYIGILAYNYGSSPANDPRSYTEIEYDAAADRMPRLIFIADAKKGFRVDPDMIEPDEMRSKQKAFRERAGVYVGGMFTTPGDLATKVVTALSNIELRAKEKKPDSASGEPEMKLAMDRARRDFEQASTQIYVLNDQKQMHDELHHLQTTVVGQLVLQAQNFPSEQACDALSDHTITLEGAIENLKNTAAHTKLTTADSVWIEKLEAVKDQVMLAVATGDRSLLDKAIREISRIMATQPSVINDRLKSAAKALRLGDLVESLQAVRERMQPLDSVAGQKFQDGVAMIQTLSTRLVDLTNRHDAWQQIDRDIRQIEANLRYGIAPIVDAWPGIREQVEPLADENPKLVATMEGLDLALASSNEKDIERAFKLFNAQAGRTFYLVDAALKKLCLELRKINELTSVLMLQ